MPPALLETVTLAEAAALIEVKAKSPARNGKSRPARKLAKKAKATATPGTVKKPAKKAAAKKPEKEPYRQDAGQSQAPPCGPNRQSRREPQARRQTEAGTGAPDLAGAKR